MKVVINGRFGGFSISLAAAKHMAAAGSVRAQKEVAEHDATLAMFAKYKADGTLPEGESDFTAKMFDINIRYGSEPDFHGYGYVHGSGGGYERDDPLLVAAVEALGPSANGKHSSLRIVEIPDGIEWEINEYDGNEHIAEKHRTWG